MKSRNKTPCRINEEGSSQIETTHITHIYIYIYLCVCVCLCVHVQIYTVYIYIMNLGGRGSVNPGLALLSKFKGQLRLELGH